jgi:hypothetical protein
LGEKGLTAGRFYTIYNPDAAVPIEDEALRNRFESKRDADLAEIHERMEQVEIERAYRIVGSLEQTARDIEDKALPFIRDALERWRSRVIWGDVIVFGALMALFAYLGVQAGYWDNGGFSTTWLDTLIDSPMLASMAAATALILVIAIHYGVRGLARKSVAWSLRKSAKAALARGDLIAAFKRGTAPWRSIFYNKPAGWSRRTRARLHEVIGQTDEYVQTLNNRFTNPAGRAGVASEPANDSTATPGQASATQTN